MGSGCQEAEARRNRRAQIESVLLDQTGRQQKHSERRELLSGSPLINRECDSTILITVKIAMHAVVCIVVQ